eukprot:scaffold5373_cov103-Isochrysis_galbana.AAC.7
MRTRAQAQPLSRSQRSLAHGEHSNTPKSSLAPSRRATRKLKTYKEYSAHQAKALSRSQLDQHGTARPHLPSPTVPVPRAAGASSGEGPPREASRRPRRAARSATVGLEALAVDDGRARLVVLLLGDPHLLEGGQRRQDGAADPDRVLALWRCNYLDLHRGWRERGDLLGHAVGDAGVHGGATRQDDVGVQVLTDVNVALHDGVVRRLVHAGRLHAEEGRLEERLRAAEALVADGDDLAVGQLVRLLEGGRRGGGLHLLVEVKGDVRELLLDVAHNLALGRGGEGVAALGQQLDHPIGQCVALVDGHSVRDAVARVHHDTRGAARRVQGEDGLDGDVHGRHVEGLEHDLRHLLTVGLGVERRLGEEDRVLLGRDAQLVVKGVVPDLLHVVPVCHDAVLDRVLKGEDATLRLRLVAHVRVLLAHADHHAGLAWAADDGREDGARGVVAREAGLAHAGPVVNHERSNVEGGRTDKRWRRGTGASGLAWASNRAGRVANLKEGKGVGAHARGCRMPKSASASRCPRAISCSMAGEQPAGGGTSSASTSTTKPDAADSEGGCADTRSRARSPTLWRGMYVELGVGVGV